MSLMYECDMGEEVGVTSSSPEEVYDDDEVVHFKNTFKHLESLARCLICRKCEKLPKEKVWTLGCCLTKYCEECVVTLSGQRCLSCKKSGYPKDVRPDLFSSSILSEIPSVYMTILRLEELSCDKKKAEVSDEQQQEDEVLDKMDVVDVNQKSENDKEEVVINEIQTTRDPFEFDDDIDMQILQMPIQGTPKDQVMVSQDFPEVLEETPQSKVLGRSLRASISSKRSGKRAAFRTLKLPSQELSTKTENKDSDKIKMKTPSPSPEEKGRQSDGDEELFQTSPAPVVKERRSDGELPVLTPYVKINKLKLGTDSTPLKEEKIEESRGKRGIKKCSSRSNESKPPELTPHKKDLLHNPMKDTENDVKIETVKRSTRLRKSSVSSTDSKKSGRGRKLQQQKEVNIESPVCKEKGLETEINPNVLVGDIPKPRNKSLGRKRRTSSASVTSNSSISSGRASALNATIPGSSTPASKEKRNDKGETALHVACRAGLLDKVTTLVESGADVNAKDHLEWTPIHELIIGKGTIENKMAILRLICEKGVDVNAFGGYEEETPLHFAVLHGAESLVEILLEFGASPNIRNKRAELPKDLAFNEIIINMLEEKMGMVSSPHAGVNLNNSTLSEDPALMQTMLRKAIIYFNYDVDPDIIEAVKEKFNLKVADVLNENVTHVIHKFSGDKDKLSSCVQISMEFLYALANCMWQVSSDWITDSLREGRCLVPCPYEIHGYVGNEREDSENSEEMAPGLARMNHENGNPGLLDGFCFYLYKTCGYTDGTLKLTKKQLTDLIKAAGGKVTNREHNPDVIDPLDCPPRFHVQNNAGRDDGRSDYNMENLTLTTHIILYDDISAPPLEKRYNMEHVKSLKSGWLIHSLAKFRLQDPNNYL